MTTRHLLRIDRMALVAALGLAAASAADAQVAARDAATGDLRAPTSEEVRALQSRGSTSGKTPAPRGLLTGVESPQVVRRADGSDELEHDDSMLNFSVVTVLPDGRLASHCVGSAQSARDIALGKRVAFARNMVELTHAR